MTNDQIVARLEEAGRTLLMLPPAGVPGRLKPVAWDHVAPAVKEFQWSVVKLRCTPGPAAIDRMDEALGWLSLIRKDRFILRRIVAARAMVSPLTNRHLYPWRRLGTLLGADHKAIQRWHADGIDMIRNAMPDADRRAA